MRSLVLCALFAVISLLIPNSVEAAPSIQNISDNKGSYPNQAVPTYEKLEIKFEVTNTTAGNNQLPYISTTNQNLQLYNQKGISVGAVFSNPSGQTFYQPGFYYQEYYEDSTLGSDWKYPTGKLYWVVRFSPNTIGNWKYKLVVQDAGGITESTEKIFSVIPSNNKGFLQVSKADPRYFEFDNGEYFSSLGYEKEISSESQVQELQEKGINSIREWISSDGIYGSQWSRWVRSPRTYDGYLPRTPIVAASIEPDGNRRSYYYVRHYAPGGTNWYTPCMNLDDQNPYPRVKKGTNYYIEVEYMAKGLQRNDTNAYGLVVKKLNWDEEGNCMKSGVGDVLTDYGTTESSFSKIKGVWNSGTSKNIPKLFLALENNKSGVDSFVYIKSISVREMTGGTVSNPSLAGPNLIDEPYPNQLEFMEQSASYELDKKMAYMDQYDVYARWVVLEKEEDLFKKIDANGYPGQSPSTNNFYGSGRNYTAARFLQEAWFRYLQARWGYSTRIMAWELVNEGDPAHSGHYALTDEMGKTFKCRAFNVAVAYTDGATCDFDHPNAHMTSTSFWHSFPGSSFWENTNYPNVDFADVHAYISTSYAPLSEREKMPYDAAYFHYWHSKDLAGWNIGKPIIRGEAGMDSPSQQSHNVLNIQQDTQGIWLHNYNWASLYSGGLIETYWWVNEHIDFGSVDNRHKYKLVANFLKGIPLNNGQYEDAAATVTNDPQGLVRAWGQKDLVNGNAHLWIQNSKHTWKNVVDGVSIPSVSPTIQIAGFTPNKPYTVEKWDTYTGAVSSSTNATASANGTITLTVSNLTTDTAFKILNPDAPTPTGTTYIPGDTDNDGDVDIFDYSTIITNFGKAVSTRDKGDLDGDGDVDIFDYNQVITNFGT